MHIGVCVQMFVVAVVGHPCFVLVSGDGSAFQVGWGLGWFVNRLRLSCGFRISPFSVDLWVGGFPVACVLSLCSFVVWFLCCVFVMVGWGWWVGW